MQAITYLLHGKTGADDLRLDLISCIIHLYSFQSNRMKKPDGLLIERPLDFTVLWAFSSDTMNVHSLV